MRILHDGPSASPDAVNGVNAAAWTMARAQVERGDEVHFLIDAASDEQQDVAADLGIIFQPSRGILDRVRPDVIHAHSVFIPRQARLAFSARRVGIPYVIQPNGGVAPQVLARGRMKKLAYSTAVEKPRFRGASAAIAVLAPERHEIRAFAGRPQLPVHVVPNPIAPPPDVNSLTRIRCEDAVFLGRFDTHHKGLDRIAALAGRLPEITFGLYGVEDRTALPKFPSNVRLHGPVFGDEKWQLLASARIYVQMSRWEAFGISIFEAMMVGTPPVVAREMHASATVEELGGIAIDPSLPSVDIERIRELLASSFTADLKSTSRMATEAAALVDPQRVAASISSTYELALSSSRE